MILLPGLSESLTAFLFIIKDVRNWWVFIGVHIGISDSAIFHYRNGLNIPYVKGRLYEHFKLVDLVKKGYAFQSLKKNKIAFSVGSIVFQKELDGEGLSFFEFSKRLSLKGARFLDQNTILLPNNSTFKFSGGDLSAPQHIYETFFDGEYELLQVDNKTVIDVGSSIGDTPIYFATKGAKMVHAYEPNKEVFPYLVDNIKLNNLENKVLPYNVAISSKESTVCLIAQKWSGRSHVSIEEVGGYSVKALALPMNGDILKMDCEGCEFDALLNCNPNLLKFNEIMLEFHRDCKPLVRFLSQAGYTTRVVKNYDSYHGLLYAKLKK
jgi:FkbM family methyltransferase